MNFKDFWDNIEFILPSLAILGIYVLVAFLIWQLIKWLIKKKE